MLNYTLTMIESLVEDQKKVTQSIHQLNFDENENPIDLIQTCYTNQATIFTCGNGGSGATACHFTGDLIKSNLISSSKHS